MMEYMQIGESFVGEGANAAHINTVFGSRSGPTGTAWATALASPSPGHVPFVAIVRPSLPVKPFTLFVPKMAPGDDFHGQAIWGPAQAGLASGVADAVAEGVIPGDVVETHALIAAVWVNPDVDDHDAVYTNNRAAVRNALAVGARQLPNIEEVLEARSAPSNPFYSQSRDAEEGRSPI